MTDEVELNDDIIALDADDEPVTVSRGVLAAVLDVAIKSMDFGSGFLNDVDVLALQRLAAALGIDPILATPYTHTCKYRGKHTWVYHKQGWGAALPNGGWFCPLCHHSSATKPEDITPHKKPELVDPAARYFICEACNTTVFDYTEGPSCSVEWRTDEDRQ